MLPMLSNVSLDDRLFVASFSIICGLSFQTVLQMMPKLAIFDEISEFLRHTNDVRSVIVAWHEYSSKSATRHTDNNTENS